MLKIIAIKTFEPVDLPGNMTSFIATYGNKPVDSITLVDNAYFLVVKHPNSYLVPLGNVVYTKLEEPQEQLVDKPEQPTSQQVAKLDDKPKRKPK